MKNSVLAIGVIATIFVFPISAAAENRLVGTWICPVPNPAENYMAASIGPTHYRFESGGRAREWIGDDDSSPASGTYTYGNGKLTMKMSVSGETVRETDADTIDWLSASSFHLHNPSGGSATRDLVCHRDR